MASNYLFAFAAIAILLSIIGFIAQYVRAGSTIVTLHRTPGKNALFALGLVGGIVLIAVVIWSTVSSQSLGGGLWERPAFLLSGIHGVMLYLVKPRLSANGIFWDGKLIPWNNVRSVVPSPNDKENLLVQYCSSAKPSASVKLLTVESTPQVAQAIAQRVPGRQTA